MKQTPLQKMLEFTQIQIDALKSVEQDADNATVVLRFLKRQREILQFLLPYERECIEGAYKEGEAGFHYCSETPQDYFTSTYNNPQGGGGK